MAWSSAVFTFGPTPTAISPMLSRLAFSAAFETAALAQKKFVPKVRVQIVDVRLVFE